MQPARVAKLQSFSFLEISFHFSLILRLFASPAHAGNIFGMWTIPILRKDHPRVCGEKLCCAEHKAVKLGSPPHVRGKGQRSAFPPAGGGITPAYAGKRVCLD